METRKTARHHAKATTLAEVAEAAGVSIVAASVVLNGSRTATRVSEATRERILEAAAALKYTPNAVARSLLRKKTNIIAFYNDQNVSFDLTYPFYAAILAGIQKGCAEHQRDLHLHANFQGRSDDHIFHELHNGQVDGLILYAREVTPLVQRLVESRLPVVTVAEAVPGLPYVGVDEQAGGKLVAQHLAGKGYKRVLYRSLVEKESPATQIQRRQAFIDEAISLGLEVSLTEHHPWTDWPSPEEQKLLLAKRDERPEVVVCWGDWCADVLAVFCQQHGLRVPQDIALVGFDGLPPIKRPSLNLTTVFAPWQDVARTAVGLLAMQCDGQEVLDRTLLPVKLVVGDTT